MWREDHLNAESTQLPAEALQTAASVTHVVEFRLAVCTIQCLTRLHESPQCPHAVRGWTPGGDLRLESPFLDIHGLGAGGRRFVVGEVRVVKVEPLFSCGITQRVQEVRDVGMVVGCPFVEVVGDIERRWVWRSIFEVHDNDLGRKGIYEFT